jgi:hypothetical protein
MQPELSQLPTQPYQGPDTSQQPLMPTQTPPVHNQGGLDALANKLHIAPRLFKPLFVVFVILIVLIASYPITKNILPSTTCKDMIKQSQSAIAGLGEYSIKQSTYNCDSFKERGKADFYVQGKASAKATADLIIDMSAKFNTKDWTVGQKGGRQLVLISKKANNPIASMTIDVVGLSPNSLLVHVDEKRAGFFDLKPSYKAVKMADAELIKILPYKVYASSYVLDGTKKNDGTFADGVLPMFTQTYTFNDVAKKPITIKSTDYATSQVLFDLPESGYEPTITTKNRNRIYSDKDKTVYYVRKGTTSVEIKSSSPIEEGVLSGIVDGLDWLGKK